MLVRPDIRSGWPPDVFGCPGDLQKRAKGRMRSFCVGVLLERAPPLPIPNREVKAFKPDDTCCFGGWESRVCRHKRIACGFLFPENRHAPRNLRTAPRAGYNNK